MSPQPHPVRFINQHISSSIGTLNCMCHTLAHISKVNLDQRWLLSPGQLPKLILHVLWLYWTLGEPSGYAWKCENHSGPEYNLLSYKARLSIVSFPDVWGYLPMVHSQDSKKKPPVILSPSIWVKYLKGCWGYLCFSFFLILNNSSSRPTFLPFCNPSSNGLWPPPKQMLN